MLLNPRMPSVLLTEAGSLYIGPKNAVAKVRTNPLYRRDVKIDCSQGEALWRLAHTALATSVSNRIPTHMSISRA